MMDAEDSACMSLKGEEIEALGFHEGGDSFRPPRRESSTHSNNDCDSATRGLEPSCNRSSGLWPGRAFASQAQ
ncbi:hypothetical protein D3X12_15560 [Pseudomonas protegens]|uniref:Uncharacterized protein n=1 Tax=Pseudomonas protegens TaxID=380021 RepID=A0ABY2VHB6_9PSED|nr:hypothetical protein CEP86_29220 [Pseudomonas protegens]QEZ52014.1 hypothetical protein D3X12_15560 [Pseudomonas protegens]QEZ55916.1 hypothetical protein D4N38_03915 [Pseudomonas protegens]QEZ63275.1 hypothetical protein D4N37_10885 [Pseudomonas protegens]TMM63697.1 hypothetical protein FEF10_10515 [Pseudomonas protegens]